MIHAQVLRFHSWLESYCPPFPEQLPSRPPNTLSGFVTHYAKPFWPLILVCAILSVIGSVIDVYLFAFVGELVDWLAEEQPETFWETYETQLIATGFLVLVIAPTIRYIYEAVSHQGLLGNFAMRTRWQAHRYLLRQSIEFYQNDFAGRVAAKMMQTSLGVRDAVIKVTEVLLYVAVYFTAAIVLFAQSDIRLTAPMIFWLAGYIVTLRYFIPRLRQISMEQAEARSMVTGRVVDSYTNITTVKMFADGDAEDLYAREGMNEFLETVYRQMRLSTFMTMALVSLNAILLFSVAATSIYLWQISAVSVGAIAFAMGLVLRMQGMSQWILWEIAGLFENIGVIQDGIETISRDVSIIDKDNANTLQVDQGRIKFENVTFNYGQEKPFGSGGIIENFSLSVEGGEKIGVVGRSGAGKSTLINLLIRFYDVERGVISIDNQNISAVSQTSLRSRIGMVTQDTSLLHRSVIDNIRYGRPEASDDEVYEAARRAKADDFIPDLTDLSGRKGYQAHVGERGVKLSGGQRQRIAIARVLLKNAPILILDEATSALDSEVEAAIQESLYELMQGKTVIAIAHRLSTIAEMDRLIIMDKGHIVESGKHAELVKDGGLYASLWSRQSGGFLDYQL
ncbi:MAG: ABC transporter ATP-binding protein/permease [Acidiferrobacterales bacterium]|nr:ABC transporter ATP-binding protein/permease [Acidiferrobacterales bacterium]